MHVFQRDLVTFFLLSAGLCQGLKPFFLFYISWMVFQSTASVCLG